MNPKILLIDDERDILAIYEDMLGEYGFEVTKAQTKAEAITALGQEGPWDVIILDEKLGGPGGPSSAAQMLLEITARDPAARTIV
jgi:DNA-binding NtrC family response regulator